MWLFWYCNCKLNLYGLDLWSKQSSEFLTLETKRFTVNEQMLRWFSTERVFFTVFLLWVICNIKPSKVTFKTYMRFFVGQKMVLTFKAQTTLVFHLCLLFLKAPKSVLENLCGIFEKKRRVEDWGRRNRQKHYPLCHGTFCTVGSPRLQETLPNSLGG